jgi:N-acetylneuraminic acid mutarotase
MVQTITTSLGGLVEKVDEMKTGLKAMENRFDGMKNTHCDQATPADRSNDVKDAKRPNEYAYVVAGGYNSNSVEIFDKTTNSWIKLQPMKKSRANASSVVYNGEVLVTGGSGQRVLTSMEQFSQNANPFVPPCWSNRPVNLPMPLRGHRTVLYNGRLIVLGGYDDDGNECDMIYEIQLHFPFTTKVLAELPPTTPIKGCGAVLANDKILMFGGRTREESNQATANVTMYDITKNEFKELAPLPYEVCNMATVKCGENVILAGGAAIYPGSDTKTTVISYNIETEESTELPPMKQERCECCAVVDGNSLVVMGGGVGWQTQNLVEAFDFKTSKWSDLPSMNQGRKGFIAEIV